jgi:hypothetical protein
MRGDHFACMEAAMPESSARQPARVPKKEHDLMKALRERVDEEQMPRIAMAVYLSSRQLPSSQINDVFAAGRKECPIRRGVPIEARRDVHERRFDADVR